jgi:hypothetical protein
MEAKTKKIILIGSILGGLGIITYFLLSGKRKALLAKIKAGSTDVIVPAQSTISSVAFPLKNGSGSTTAEKNAVKVVQRYINAKSSINSFLGIDILKEDGIFGPLTEAALYKLQGVKTVSYSVYLDMQSYLSSAPELLSTNASAYDSGIPTYLDPNTDPYVVKNDLFDITDF